MWTPAAYRWTSRPSRQSKSQRLSWELGCCDGRLPASPAHGLTGTIEERIRTKGLDAHPIQPGWYRPAAATSLNIHPSRHATILAVPITDTSPSAQALQLQIQRAMPGEQRLLLALEMSLFARELAKERVRREYPEWSDEQVARELVRLAFLPAPVPARLR